MYTEVTPYVSADEIDAKPEIGCYISGLFLEGAIWDAERRVLAHPSDRGLARELPILRLVPIERTTMPSSSSSSSTTNAFKAPVYFTQSRRDAMGRGLVFQADLASSEHASAWILRGVACVLNIDA
jgi:dynein heavy chain